MPGVRAARYWGIAGLATWLLAASCTGGGSDHLSGGIPADRGPGFVNEAWLTRRQDDFLRFITTSREPPSALNLISRFERSDRDKAFKFDAATVRVGDFADSFKRLDTFADTGDFDLLYLINLWYADRDHLPKDVRAAIEKRILAFKYWYTEPTPKGVIDQKWYWSENHRAIFHTVELLAGQAFPEATFTNDGRTGAQHAAHAKRLLEDWFTEKARFGFSEWHSDVYYQKDITPLLTLVEFAADARIARQASIVLDQVLLDIALHLQKGDFGATHGRSYMKDKSVATDEDTFGLAKLLFDDTPKPYQPGSDAGATLMARARKYRLPEVIRRIAKSDKTMVDRERMGVPLDANSPVVDNPPAPYGYSFGASTVPFWWERGALTAWQELPTTFATAERYGLWATDFFKPFAGFRGLGKDPKGLQKLAQSLAPQLAFGLLSEVNTYTWRSRDAMLSTAQDYRPGMRGDQYHSWQATLDGEAVVFTTLPGNEPRAGDKWVDADMYWTGEAAAPRSAQHGRVVLNLYAPAYPPAGPGSVLESLSYLPMTHAWFPSERFDQVVRDGNWTFGRKGDGYVALWSWRPVHWRQHDPAQVPTGGLVKDFDLVADGGADNVWITEVGEASRWKTFAEFRQAVATAPITATPRPPTEKGLPAGFDVTYRSPSEGQLDFSSDGPLTVDGRPEDLRGYPRMDNPWVSQPFGSRSVRVQDGAAMLNLDTRAWKRTASS